MIYTERMKPLAENRRAYFDYEILEKYEAGIVLSGPEVKSIRSGHINLAGAFVTMKPNGAFLINASVPPYQSNNTPPDYEPTRTRQLLLNKKELAYLYGKAKEGGLTIIPLAVYSKGRRIKVEIALARHKKKQDKRETIKKREFEREKRRAINE